jgi:outer membrane protein assembly factor BamB
VVTNRCEILCFDVAGLANGNQGMQDEAAYKAGPEAEPMPVGPRDADILWIYDMRSELGVFPHNIASSSVLVKGGKVFCTTSNGVDWSHTNIPAPNAPSLVVLDAESGAYLGEQDPVVSTRVLHCSWSSPALGEVDGEDLLVFAGGDGWAYGLGTDAGLAEGEDPDDPLAVRILPERWRFDCNAPEYRIDPETGESIRYVAYEGPSECVGTPVVYDGLVYVCIGQDPEHGEGVGRISALDPKGQGDLSGQQVWEFKGIGRSISTPSIADGVLYISDYSGRVYALDAKTGEPFWEFDTKGHIWGSTLAVDGKVLIANEEGELYVLSGGKEGGEELALLEFPAPIYSSPVIANGIMYLATQTHLYAFGRSAAASGAQAAAATAADAP